jgi:hypothetical protein
MNKRNNQTDPPKPMRIYEVEAEIGSEPLTQPFITNALLVACDAGCFLLAWLLVVPIESIPEEGRITRNGVIDRIILTRIGFQPWPTPNQP